MHAAFVPSSAAGEPATTTTTQAHVIAAPRGIKRRTMRKGRSHAIRAAGP